MTVQTEDIYRLDGVALDGIDFATNNDNLTIATGVLVGSADQIGVQISGSADVLDNKGMIVGYNPALNVAGPGANITNELGGLIFGQFYGVNSHADSSSITNHGTIDAVLFDGVAFSNGTNNYLLDNDGTIHGHNAEIVSAGTSGTCTINNTGSGLISGRFYGVELTDPASIYNAPDATISGGFYSVISSEGGAITLRNFGKLVGGIWSTIASDVITNHGSIGGDILLGDGDDTYIGVGSGVVAGTIHGGDGADRFVADKAREIFFGDAGADTFVFKSTAFSPATAKRDVIGDFTHLADKIDVHAIDADTTHAGHQAFVFIGTDTFAHHHSLHPGVVGMLRFNAAGGVLQGNVNADFTHADFAVALPHVTALHANDFIFT